MINFIDTFPSHLFIEMCYGRQNRFGFIYEQNLCNSDFKQLCESYGLFNGCDKISDIIYEKSCECNNKGVNLFNIKISNCDFIDVIVVQLIDGNIDSYIADKSVIDKNKKFNPLVLYVGINGTSQICKSAIMHELTHAYEDYKRCVGKAQTLMTKAKNIGYDKNPIGFYIILLILKEMGILHRYKVIYQVVIDILIILERY